MKNNTVRDALRLLEQQRRIYCTIGEADPDNLGQYFLSGSTGLRVKVTFDDGTVHEAINTRVTPYPGLRVWVDRDVQSGELFIGGTDVNHQVELFGSAAPNADVPPHSHGVGYGAEDPVEARRILPGLMHASSGLNVQIEPFWYVKLDGSTAKCVGGLYDVTSVLPSTSGYHAWIKVYWNPSTLAFGAVKGTEYSLTIPLTDTELAAVSIPADCYEIGAVQLWQGQTVINEEKYFSDPRVFLQRRMDGNLLKSLYDANTILKADSDNTPAALTVAEQRIVGRKTGGSITALTGSEVAGILGYGAAGALTIAGGAITVTQRFHKIDTESGAASDDLDTINGGAEGNILVLRAADDTHTVVAKNGTGNLKLAGSDFSLDSVNDTLQLIYDGTNWLELSRSNNG